MSESDEEYLEEISDGDSHPVPTYGTRSSEWKILSEL